DVDPNVHPAKVDVRLARESDVAAALGDAVRNALARAPARPSVADDFSALGSQYALPITRRYLAEGQREDSALSPDEQVSESLRSLRVLGQVKETLILAEGNTG